MDHPMPSQPTITGVAQALLVTLDADQAVAVLLTQFGWDRAFLALSHVDDVSACTALWLALQRMTD